MTPWSKPSERVMHWGYYRTPSEADDSVQSLIEAQNARTYGKRGWVRPTTSTAPFLNERFGGISVTGLNIELRQLLRILGIIGHRRAERATRYAAWVNEVGWVRYRILALEAT